MQRVRVRAKKRRQRWTCVCVCHWCGETQCSEVGITHSKIIREMSPPLLGRFLWISAFFRMCLRVACAHLPQCYMWYVAIPHRMIIALWHSLGHTANICAYDYSKMRAFLKFKDPGWRCIYIIVVVRARAIIGLVDLYCAHIYIYTRMRPSKWNRKSFAATMCVH